MRYSDCASSWKVWIKPQGQQGQVNTAKAQKEEPIDLKVSEVLEKYYGLINAPEQIPLTRAIIHQVRLFDEAILPPK